jgi:hypothetical protein
MGLMNKRGIFFLLLTILLITFFLISYTFYSVLKDRTAIEKRVETMNSFVVAAEDDLERRMFIAGFRAIFIFQEFVIGNQTPIVDVDAGFDELFFSATFNGASKSIMNGATFDDIAVFLNEKASNIGANLSMTNPVVTIDQVDPWNVRVTLTSDFVLEDLSGLVKWDKVLVTEAFVPIDKFADPLYVLNTGALVVDNVTRTPYKDFVDGSDIANFSVHALSNYYNESADAPNFLQRLMGDTSADPDGNGIESFVNLDRFASLGITQFEKSVVDHIYFSGANPSTTCISGMDNSWFRIDSNHVEDYELTGVQEACV